MTEPKLSILIVGASGALGQAVTKELSTRHKVITAGRNTGDLRLDLNDVQSLHAAFEKIGKIDAVVSAAGEVAFLPLHEIKAAPLASSTYSLGLHNKLMGQVNLALIAREFLKDGGSITLTSGILSDHPIAAGSSASMVNGALNAFVMAAAVEMPRGIRINVVSPNVLTESMPSFGPFFRGFESVPAARAALAFSRSVEGLQTGQIYKVY